MDLHHEFISSPFLNSETRMTKTKVHQRTRVTVKLNSFTVKKMVQDIINKLCGTKPCGQLQHYFNDTALNSLQEAAETFLENMWEQLLDMSDNEVTVQHVQLWKRDTGFKLRVKNNDLSLCELFNE